MVLLGFSVAVVMATLFNKDNRVYTAPYNIPPGGAFVLFWFLIIWLAMMEGGQGALVGLQPVDKSLYATTHPRTQNFHIRVITWSVSSLVVNS